MLRLVLTLLLAAPVAAPTVIAPGQVSTDANEYNLDFTADGRTAVFARSEADFRNARIMVAETVGGSFVSRPIAFTDPRFSDTDPQVSDDGATIVFVSDRPRSESGQPSDLDLWRARKVDGVWGAPEPLAGVGSPGVELGPEMHGGVLYFNSSRSGGPGKLDIYAAGEAGGEFVALTVLPAPINSPASEGDFTLSPDGRVALFWSDRPGGLGEGDIWLSTREGPVWSTPVNLGPEVNSPQFDFTPAFSPDGRTLIFSSTRPRDGKDRLSDVYAIPVDQVPALKSALQR